MIRDEIKRLSIEALRNRDSDRRAMLTGILSRFTEEEKSEGFSGWTEDLERDVVERYVKSLEKAILQIGGGPIAERYQVEVDLLRPYLPSRLGEEQTRSLVEPLAAQSRSIGQFMGLVMRQYKGQVDPEVVRRIGTELGLK